MLVEFSVENFLSFRDRVTLSMVSARREPSLPGRILESAQGTKLNLIKSAAIYGPNASGKSNLLNAIEFMERFVRESARGGGADTRIAAVPFKLNEESRSKPSTFEVIFLSDGVRYVYGFTVDCERVWREWLSTYPRGQERVLFDRSINEQTGDPSIYFGPSWEGAKKQLVELTRANALLVSVGEQFNHRIARQVYRWFSEKLQRVSWFPTLGAEREFTCALALDDVKRRDAFLQFWKKADPGISDFTVKKIPLQEAPQWSDLPDTLRQQLVGKLPKDAFTFDVHTLHAGTDAHGNPDEIPFDFDEESDGTQKLFALAGPWRYVLENGCIVVVDELDARLHPLLTRWLIELFHNEKTNPSGAQLIFATHDVSLLEPRSPRRSLFRRDQIWFTERDARGATSLYSLWDFKKPPRRQENIRLGYLAGRYGAVPFTESVTE